MYSIHFSPADGFPATYTACVEFDHIVVAQTYWDKLSKSGFHMISTRP